MAESLQPTIEMTSVKYTSGSSVKECGPCLSDGIAINASGFCLECDEFLCEDCIGYHRRLRLTKTHLLECNKEVFATFQAAEAKGYVFEDLKDSLKCSIHTSESSIFFCKTHEAGCCQECSEDTHAACKKDLVAVLAEGYAKSDEYTALIERIGKMSANIKRLYQAEFAQNTTKVNDFKSKCSQFAEEVSKALISSFIKDSTNELGDKLIKETEKRKAIIQKIDTQVRQIQCLIDATQHSDTELYCFAKRIAADLNRAESEIQNCKARIAKPWIVSLNRDLLVTRFGELLHFKPTSVLDVTTKFPEDENPCQISHIKILPDGLFVVTDSANRSLKLFKANGTLESRIELDAAPNYVEELLKGTLFVSFNDDNCVQTVTLADKIKLGKKINVDAPVTGMVALDERLFVAFQNYILILNKDGIIMERFAKNFNGDSMFSNIRCLTVNKTTSDLYLIDSTIIKAIGYDRKLKASFDDNNRFTITNFVPSMAFDIDESLYVSTATGIVHLTNDLRFLQCIVYTSDLGFASNPSSSAVACDTSAGKLYISGTHGALKVVQIGC